MYLHFYKEYCRTHLCSLQNGCGVKNIFDVTDVNASAVVGGAHSGSTSGYAVGWGRSFFLKLTYNFIKN